MIIDCDTCLVRDQACGECVVTFLTIAPRTDRAHELELTDGERGAIGVLAASGLVPPLRAG